MFLLQVLVVFVFSHARAAEIVQSVRFADVRSNNRYNNERLPANCFEATYTTQRSGLYVIQPFTQDPFMAYCDAETRGGGWTVFQRRKDGSVDFYRDWKSYKEGFGNTAGEFWIGLERLHALTISSQELLVVMEDFYSKSVHAKYDSFAIGNESDSYRLKDLGRYTGDAGDALSRHKNCTFATKDKDSTTHNCATKYMGAWWYEECMYSNLNGLYYRGPNEAGRSYTIWNHFHISSSLKYVAMMVRPKRS